MDKSTDDKKTRLLSVLEKGLSMIHLDARRPGVLLPEHLRAEAHLMLNLSYRFEPFDLSVSEWGVRSTLTFSGRKFQVAVPWSAIYALGSHVTKEFWMYPEDMPTELLAQAQLTSKVSVDAVPQSPPPKPQLVCAAPPPPEEPSGGGDDSPKPRGRAHLRLVK